MQVLRHTLYQLQVDGRDAAGAFVPQQYSRFKYGARTAAQHFGVQLAESFLQDCVPQHLQLVQPGWLLTASAYKTLPTAAHAAAFYFEEALAQAGLSSPEPCRLVRHTLFEGEYEKLGFGARRTVLKNSGITLAAPSLSGRTLVVLDDIRVTGAHEYCILNLLQGTGLAAVCFVYIAQVPHAHTDPRIEHRLNSAEIDTLAKLRTLIQTEEVVLNARLCKRLLLWPTPGELHDFLHTLPPQFVAQVAQAAMQEGYAACPRLAPAVQVLQTVAQHLAAPLVV